MSLLIAMAVYGFAMSITPGPVNILVLSSGVNYGIRNTMVFVFGAAIGFTILLLSIGLVFEQFIQAFPFVLNYLAVVGSLYIIFMGYKIIVSKSSLRIRKTKMPGFHQGFMLQWLNPKAWMAAISGVTIFSSPQSYGPLLIFSAIYFVVCFLSLVVWAVLGKKISAYLKNDFHLKLFNYIMGILLMITALYLIYFHFD